ncbi:MAG TPA: SMP-30/gluconolactonase/LRE family protein [Candidatus Binatia bacterium]|jgi:gluconolactonase|nr:SMP-30/gluconolactonase/LRE family protein [Candidatus Binatia bacterium]
MAYQQLNLDQVTSAATGFKGPEGVTVDREGNVYGGGTDGVIRKLSPDGKVTEFARTGGRPAGMALDRQGNLFVCDVGKAAVLKVTPSGAVNVFADQVGSVKLFLPNFPVFDAEGNLYVSNSTNYALTSLEQVMAEVRNPVPNGALVRLRPDGRGEVAATGLYFANGTAIDPKEEAVYVLQSTQNNCARIAMRKDGTHGKTEVFGGNLGGLPDGMAFDAEGYLIITLPMINRLVVLDPTGKLSVLLDDPDGKKTQGPTNCAFGGPQFDDLYIAHLEADHVAKVHLGHKGHPLYDRR